MKMSKNLFSLFLCLVIMLSTVAFNGFALDSNMIINTPLTEADIEEAYDMGTSVLKEYYRSIVTVKGDEDNTKCAEEFTKKLNSLATTEGLGEFICTKFDYRNYVSEQTGIVYSKHTSKFKLLNYKIIDKALYLKIQVDVIENYLDGSESGFGEPVEMLFVRENGNLKIADWYTDNYYDGDARGYYCKIDNPNFWKDKDTCQSIMTNSEKLLAKTKSTFKTSKTASIINLSEVEQNEEQALIPMATVTSFSTTNRANMASYALTNCSKSTPASGGSSVTFKNINPGCTEFVSHVLLSGGAKPYKTSSTSTGWWSDSSGHSESWSSVSKLYSFLVSNASKGPRGTASVYAGLPQFSPNTNLSAIKGDIIQLDYSNYTSTYDHSTVITGLYDDPSGIKKPKITSRTNSSSYTYNKTIDDAYPSTTYARTITLKGYIN